GKKLRRPPGRGCRSSRFPFTRPRSTSLLWHPPKYRPINYLRDVARPGPERSSGGMAPASTGRREPRRPRSGLPAGSNSMSSETLEQDGAEIGESAPEGAEGTPKRATQLATYDFRRPHR